MATLPNTAPYQAPPQLQGETAADSMIRMLNYQRMLENSMKQNEANNASSLVNINAQGGIDENLRRMMEAGATGRTGLEVKGRSDVAGITADSNNYVADSNNSSKNYVSDNTLRGTQYEQDTERLNNGQVNALAYKTQDDTEREAAFKRDELAKLHGFATVDDMIASVGINKTLELMQLGEGNAATTGKATAGRLIDAMGPTAAAQTIRAEGLKSGILNTPGLDATTQGDPGVVSRNIASAGSANGGQGYTTQTNKSGGAKGVSYVSDGPNGNKQVTETGPSSQTVSKVPLGQAGVGAAAGASIPAIKQQLVANPFAPNTILSPEDQSQEVRTRGVEGGMLTPTTGQQQVMDYQTQQLRQQYSAERDAALAESAQIAQDNPSVDANYSPAPTIGQTSALSAPSSLLQNVTEFGNDTAHNVTDIFRGQMDQPAVLTPEYTQMQPKFQAMVADGVLGDNWEIVDQFRSGNGELTVRIATPDDPVNPYVTVQIPEEAQGDNPTLQQGINGATDKISDGSSWLMDKISNMMK